MITDLQAVRGDLGAGRARRRRNPNVDSRRRVSAKGSAIPQSLQEVLPWFETG